MIRKIIILFSIVLIVACSSSDDSSSSNTDDFSRSDILVNLADNIIIPSLQDFDSKMSLLRTSVENFTISPNQANLNEARLNWLTANKAWQHVEMFNIGKAEELNQYYYFMNIYPTTVSDIEAGVSTGNYDLDSASFHDAQGFPALDYLLYGVGSDDTSIIAKYASDANAEGYKTYINAVVNQMDDLTQQVLSDWTNVYRNQFVASTENTATSSLNKIVNDYIFYYEKGLRANKFGIPSGVFSTNPLPEKVEAFYNKTASKELSLEALNAVQDVFNGRSYNGLNTGASFKSYLDYLNAEREGQNVSMIINNQFNTARAKIQDLDANFNQQIITDNAKMTMAYDALQMAVVYLKVDMVQSFNISLDFQDADGD